MRRTGLRAAGAVLLALPAVAGPPTSAHASATVATVQGLTVQGFGLDLTHGTGHRVQIYPAGPGAWKPGRTLGYWGRFTGNETGSWRATCIWLADQKWPNSKKQDNRLFCTVILSFRAGLAGAPDPNASGLVLQGLVKRPPANGVIFEYPSNRQLAITGGTGKYKGAQGYADIRLAWRIVIHFDDLVPA
jgi:hypothetical protein